MTAPGEWIHIADHAWELYGLNVHYTLHQENDQWVVRSFTQTHGGDTAKNAEESAPTVEQAKQIVDRWESRRQP